MLVGSQIFCKAFKCHLSTRRIEMAPVMNGIPIRSPNRNPNHRTLQFRRHFTVHPHRRRLSHVSTTLTTPSSERVRKERAMKVGKRRKKKTDDGPSISPADCTVGSIVWVRRRNGSWWPGQILGPQHVSSSHLTSPRSGTPVKLLGREDASVSVYQFIFPIFF